MAPVLRSAKKIRLIPSLLVPNEERAAKFKVTIEESSAKKQHAASLLGGLVHVLEVQWHCLTQDFTHPGLPWEPPAPECRSILAGGSGCLYALPMLVCPSYGEKMLWVLQAFFSVWADYFNIHRRSVSHGLDRLMATSMALRMVNGYCLQYCCTKLNDERFVLGMDWHFPHQAGHGAFGYRAAFLLLT